MNDWEKGETSIYKMQLENALKLSEYAKKENVEKIQR